MTPSPEYLARLRVAIAESESWFNCYIAPNRKPYGTSPEQREQHAQHPREVPDYCNSRDAIVDAILRRFVTIEEQDAFDMHLARALPDRALFTFKVATATALQLALAYARAASLDVKEGGE